MALKFPDQPKIGDALSPAFPSTDTVDHLLGRRSTAADFLCEPGPDEAQLGAILTIAARAPDHRRVTPFRFLIFAGDARERAGAVLAEAFAHAEPDADAERREKERSRFLRAPVVVAVVARLNREHRTPVWEQTLTLGAVCQNFLIAAGAFGFAAQWLTEWYAYDRQVLSGLGLEADEDMAGFIYIGSASANPKERPRVDASALSQAF